MLAIDPVPDNFQECFREAREQVSRFNELAEKLKMPELIVAPEKIESEVNFRAWGIWARKQTGAELAELVERCSSLFRDDALRYRLSLFEAARRLRKSRKPRKKVQ